MQKNQSEFLRSRKIQMCKFAVQFFSSGIIGLCRFNFVIEAAEIKLCSVFFDINSPFLFALAVGYTFIS